MSITRIKSDNLSCRISSEHKQLIEQAAKLSGFSMSDFITHALVSAASEMLREEPVIQLTKSEWDRFTTSLDRPARKPSAATKKVVELFNQGSDEGDRQVW
ncbi:MAG: DUF1778 domain-containing protein [Armatimonadetes bacterium]|nr:DUF1778 domain-containing protein [Armatimonadota bacterium]